MTKKQNTQSLTPLLVGNASISVSPFAIILGLAAVPRSPYRILLSFGCELFAGIPLSLVSLAREQCSHRQAREHCNLMSLHFSFLFMDANLALAMNNLVKENQINETIDNVTYGGKIVILVM